MTDGTGFDEHVFIRGNHATPGDLAPRQFLTALSHEKGSRFTQGSGRLELARCLTDPSDPLLSRVMVNRVWLHLFGRGIVPTPDDFGKLGQPPSHPQLLDWLATWYRTDAGWSTKKLVRLLVTSSAYRMSSKPADPLAEEKDPDNSLLHRMPIRRLEGEALDGAARRSIYLEVRRNFLLPMMRTFDTPVPFTTVGRRTVSNVPAQSLILLNDPFVFGQAQLWAKRLLKDPKCSPEQRINRIYSAAFGRPATADEQRKALEFIQRQSISYGIGASECLKDERVWTDLCHVTFNIKEFAFIE
jgi:hypothetical protein